MKRNEKEMKLLTKIGDFESVSKEKKKGNRTPNIYDIQ
jgi:hypothetical protein